MLDTTLTNLLYRYPAFFLLLSRRPEYVDTLRTLLELGPPSSPNDSSKSSTNESNKDVVFSSLVSQAVLVTQIGMADNVSPNGHMSDDGAFDWPKDHLQFLDSVQAQRQVVLNVAATPPSCPPFEQERGKIRMVAPGSLRQYGDFCLIDVGLHLDETDKDENNTVDQRRRRRRQTFTWRVDRVQFRNMNTSD